MRTWVALVGAIALCAALSTLSSLRVSDLEANRRVELRQMARHRLEARSIGVSARWRTSGPAPSGGAPADEEPAPAVGARSAVSAETARPAYLVPAAPAAHAAAASSAVAPGAYSEAAAVAAGCKLPRRPYHTVLTSSSGLYQAWQSKIAHHHYKLQKARDPCGEMGGFTRLLTSHSGKWQAADDADMPTVVVSEVRGGYPVVNRPHSMLQFVGDDELFRKTVKEEYVYIAETDHILLRPLPNLATRTTPAAFHFGYMVADGQVRHPTARDPSAGDLARRDDTDRTSAIYLGDLAGEDRREVRQGPRRQDGPGRPVAPDHPRESGAHASTLRLPARRTCAEREVSTCHSCVKSSSRGARSPSRS